MTTAEKLDLFWEFLNHNYLVAGHVNGRRIYYAICFGMFLWDGKPTNLEEFPWTRRGQWSLEKLHQRTLLLYPLSSGQLQIFLPSLWMQCFPRLVSQTTVQSTHSSRYCLVPGPAFSLLWTEIDASLEFGTAVWGIGGRYPDHRNCSLYFHRT